jgi:CheY-like chemotaxis protein
MSPSTAGQKTVLCVDDTPYVLQMLNMFLTAVGYRTIPASNGREALEAANKISLDAVILDYEMPELNGLEVAQILKRAHPLLPILMYSARQPQTEASAAGIVDAYVEKEHPQALVMALARVLNDPPPVLVRRRFPRFATSSTFTLRFPDRDSEDSAFQGVLKDLAEGGCGGTVDAKMVPGEVVSLMLGLPQCEITLELRARVRYQNADSHGFEFLDLTAAQQKELQRCIHAIAAA